MDLQKDGQTEVSKEQDLALLKVLGSRGKENDREYVKKLAYAITQAFSKHKVARLRCVGAAAVNNADKAIIIASEEAKKNGIDLVERKSFTEVYFGDVKKYGILKEITASK